MIMILKDDKRIFCQISVTHIHNQSKRLKVSLTTDQIRVVIVSVYQLVIHKFAFLEKLTLDT